MKAELLITGISQLVTGIGTRARHGREMSELRIVSDAVLACEGGRIAWCGRAAEWVGTADVVADAGGRAVVPGLVDPHTHAMWAGDRLADFEARIRGASYESILAAGGGIRSTIRATAAATQERLVASTLQRVSSLVRAGATTIEIKSGYGFTPGAEIAMLEAIQVVAKACPARIVPTLLIHIPPADPAQRGQYVLDVTQQLIPEVARRHLADAVDVFIEKEAWSVEEARLFLECARQHDLQTKLHTDQFHSIGGLELGLEMHSLSVDHLEACTPAQLTRFSQAQTIATILPGVSLHLGIAAAPGRALIDAGAAVAVGTDLNPGSSPLYSMQAAIALSVRLNGLTAAEALIAGTINAAHAIGRPDCGRIAMGAPADFLILAGRDWRELIYVLGANPIAEVWIDGRRIVE